MYLCRNLIDVSLINIAKILNKKDHTTIMHGVKRIEADIKTNLSDNTIQSLIKFLTDLSSAKEALKECSDWYYPKGTGKIYYQPFGLKKETRPKLVYARGYENVG